jgi:hypothetical protein
VIKPSARTIIFIPMRAGVDPVVVTTVVSQAGASPAAASATVFKKSASN